MNKFTEDMKRFWGKLTPRRRMMLIGGVVATMAAIGFLGFRAPTQHWSVLFSGLDPDDAGQVIGELKNQKIPYQLDANGTAVSVPEDKVHELRITLASAGIPRGGGIGFEVFDKQSFGATSFVEQVNHLRALQGELARTIMALEAVDRARVHIAMRERSLYRKDDEPPSAAVVLKLRHGQKLSKRQVAGIVHLVASAIEGLVPGRVTVVDEKSNVLSNGADDGEAQGDLEHTLARRVEDMLARFLGPGHVVVTVTAEIDNSQTEKTEEVYDPAKSVIRGEARTVEGQGDLTQTTGGVAGARGNLPGAPAPTAQTTGTPNLNRLVETKNYEVTKILSRTIGPKSKLKRLHVAVLVDGKPPTGEVRSKEELVVVQALAREAAGLEEERGDRIEVHSIPFFVEPQEALEAPKEAAWPLPFSKQIAIYGAAGIGGLLLLAITLLIVRGRRKRAARTAHLVGPLPTALPLRVDEFEAALPGGTNHAQLAGTTPRDRALEAARADSERAARVLGAWLSEPAKEGALTK